MHLAKKAIQKQKFSVLVEGNLDVISSHQAGVQNVVATAGTALTESQLKNLGRLTPDVRLAFDEDRAGIAATERAIPIASKVGVELSVISIPSGKDPDELIQTDPKLWMEAVESHTYALDWLIGVYKNRLDLSTAAGKRQFSDIRLSKIITSNRLRSYSRCIQMRFVQNSVVLSRIFVHAKKQNQLRMNLRHRYMTKKCASLQIVC
jgi:DNA primase